MDNKITELVFIVDKSGSMAGLEEDTIGGFNSMLRKQKKLSGIALVSTYFFNHQVYKIHQRQEIVSVNPITNELYHVGGMTALIDAIGTAIDEVNSYQKSEARKGTKFKTVFVIITDGLENASEEYTAPKVKQMVTSMEKEFGWEFIFLGANIDSVETAANFGIRKDRAVDYVNDDEGVELNYAVISEVITNIRKEGKIKDSWAEEIKNRK